LRLHSHLGRTAAAIAKLPSAVATYHTTIAFGLIVARGVGVSIMTWIYDTCACIHMPFRVLITLIHDDEHGYIKKTGLAVCSRCLPKLPLNKQCLGTLASKVVHETCNCQICLPSIHICMYHLRMLVAHQKIVQAIDSKHFLTRSVEPALFGHIALGPAPDVAILLSDKTFNAVCSGGNIVHLSSQSLP
jgi:hypothetical protein